MNEGMRKRKEEMGEEEIKFKRGGRDKDIAKKKLNNVRAKRE